MLVVTLPSVALLNVVTPNSAHWVFKCVCLYYSKCHSAGCHVAECHSATFSHWHKGFLSAFVLIMRSVTLLIVMLLNVVAPHSTIGTVGI